MKTIEIVCAGKGNAAGSMNEELIVSVEVTTQQIAAPPTCWHMQVGQ